MAGIEELEVCARCGEAAGPTTRCSHCGSGETAQVRVGAGIVVSATTVRLAPPGVEVPYSLAYADFRPGPRLFARIEGEARTGDAVRLIAVDDETERYRFTTEGAEL